MMKNYFQISILYVLTLLIACNPFDQEAFNEGLATGDQQDYVVPITLPSTESQFGKLLYGEDKHTWITREFTLEGLLGPQICRLDDQMILRKDGTYLFDGGAMSCGGEDVPMRSGVYREDYTNGQLIFDEGTNDEVVVKVSGLDEGVIVLSGEVNVFGIAMTITGVYTVGK